MSKTKLLILSRYDRMGASSRLRTLDYLPYLISEGFEVEVHPFFDAAYLRQLYASGRRRFLPYLKQRTRVLKHAQQADLIWLEKEALPWMPWAIEHRYWPAHIPVVSDYDDAVFHRYDQHRRGLIRRVLGAKIDRVMQHSALVMAGNTYLANRAHSAGAPRVEVVPTVVDLSRYTIAKTRPDVAAPVIGWIGTPVTYDSFVAPMMPLLRDLAKSLPAQLRLIGAGSAAVADHVEVREWTENDEAAQIEALSIGIMPLSDTDWSRGKCGYKLIQYMACGLPVVASPVGANKDIVQHGINGFLAETPQEWRTALSTLAADASLREKMGAAGRQRVEKHYSLQKFGPKVAAMLRDVANQSRAERP